MSKRRRQKRFRLLLYNRLMSRLRIPSFLIAASLIGLWYGITSQWIDWLTPNKTLLLLSSGLLFFGFWVLTLLSPILAYVQILDDHLRLQTPIYRLKVPYEHIRNTRPVEVQKMFPPSKLSSNQRSILRPYYGRTALAIDLQGLPPPSFLLRLFFHRFTFSPDTLGLVLLVDDWLGLSRQLTTKVDEWRMAQSAHPTRGASDAADIIRHT